MRSLWWSATSTSSADSESHCRCPWRWRRMVARDEKMRSLKIAESIFCWNMKYRLYQMQDGRSARFIQQKTDWLLNLRKNIWTLGAVVFVQRYCRSFPPTLGTVDTDGFQWYFQIVECWHSWCKTIDCTSQSEFSRVVLSHRGTFLLLHASSSRR